MPSLFPGCCIKAGGAEQPVHGGTCQHPATCSEHTWSHHYYNQTNKSVLMRTQPLQRPDTLPNLPQELQQQKNLKNWSKRDIPELPLGEVEDLSCGAWESWKEVVRHGHPPRDTAPWHRSSDALRGTEHAAPKTNHHLPRSQFFLSSLYHAAELSGKWPSTIKITGKSEFFKLCNFTA